MLVIGRDIVGNLYSLLANNKRRECEAVAHVEPRRAAGVIAAGDEAAVEGHHGAVAVADVEEAEVGLAEGGHRGAGGVVARDTEGWVAAARFVVAEQPEQACDGQVAARRRRAARVQRPRAAAKQQRHEQ